MPLRAPLLAFTLLAANGLAVAQTESVTRYRCTLIDDSVHVFVEDMTKRNPGLVMSCEAMRMNAAPLRFEGSREQVAIAAPLPLSRGATVVEAPPYQPPLVALPALKGPRRKMPPEVAELVQAASLRHRLDPVLVSALIFVESRYQSNARSPKGAMGLMQLMPATAARYGVRSANDLYDPRTNVDVGVRHLRTLHDLYNGRVDLMLAAYNAGEGAVRKYGNRIPPYPETQSYVQQITSIASGAY